MRPVVRRRRSAAEPVNFEAAAAAAAAADAEVPVDADEAELPAWFPGPAAADEALL